MVIDNRNGTYSVVWEGATGRWCEVLRAPEDIPLDMVDTTTAVRYDEAVRIVKAIALSRFMEGQMGWAQSLEDAWSYCLDFEHLGIESEEEDDE